MTQSFPAEFLIDFNDCRRAHADKVRDVAACILLGDYPDHSGFSVF